MTWRLLVAATALLLTGCSASAADVSVSVSLDPAQGDRAGALAERYASGGFSEVATEVSDSFVVGTAPSEDVTVETPPPAPVVVSFLVDGDDLEQVLADLRAEPGVLSVTTS